MRILMTTDTIGGVWTFTRELTTELLKRDCAVAVASFGPLPNPAQKEWIEQQKIRWHDRFLFSASNVPLEWMTENSQAYSGAAEVMLPLVNTFQPDILLSSQYCLGALPIDIPRIVVAHSDVLSWARACRPDGLDPSEWLQCYCSIASDGIRQADAIIAPTRWMLTALGAGFMLPANVYVIPNGCTLTQDRIEPTRKIQAITAGRLWDAAKNLRILEQIHSYVPILIAGAIECESSRFEPRSKEIVLQGQLTRAELLNLFRQSSIYICTSIYEPFGFAPLEAALCGCVVVANSIPSLREVWGNHALYFKNPESLSILLTMLRENDRFRAHAQERSLTRALRLSSQRMAEMYFMLFQRLVSRGDLRSYAA